MQNPKISTATHPSRLTRGTQFDLSNGKFLNDEPLIVDNFEKGPLCWSSYDYHASCISGGTSIFALASWDRAGGWEGGGCVWTDHRRWSADVAETPISILALLRYRNWRGMEAIDLREAELSVQLRGDNLQLSGAKCYFWVHTHGTRWHYVAEPISITEGSWNTEPVRLRLRNEESAWSCNWSKVPRSLDAVLGNAISYGFSFIGFSHLVTGRLSMGSFCIRASGGYEEGGAEINGEALVSAPLAMASS